MTKHSVQLGTVRYRDYISNHLLQLRENEALPLSIDEIRQGKRWFINCSFKIPPETPVKDHKALRKIHTYYLAGALAEVILEHWEKDYIKKNLQNKHHLLKEECEAVSSKAMEFLDKKLGQVSYYQVHRKTDLVSQILTCLDNDAIFDIEGFLRFRAKDYKSNLDRAISYAVDEYILEKEYLEFIKLLKHFVDTQTSKLDTLHVGINSLGKFNLYNDHGKKITSQYLDDYSLGNSNSEFSYEDLLISSLISVAPRQIVLHIRYDGYKDTLNTIRQVFEGRVSYCTETCKICKNI